MSQSSLSPPPNLIESTRQTPQSDAALETPTDSTSPGPSVFDLTTENLLGLGSLTLDKFGQDPSQEVDGFDIPLVDPANPNATGYYLGDTTATRSTNKGDEESEEIPVIAPNEVLRFLRDTVQREFGTTSFDPLKYEYPEEPGQNGKCCILTVNRPNGLSRSYRTKADFLRKSEAKLAAANSAIKLGVIKFIKYGETSTIGGKRSMVLAKLDVGVKKDEDDSVAGLKNSTEGQGVDEGEAERMIVEIEKCCFEWRAGSVVPRWVVLVDKKHPDAYGCALKMVLSPHVQRTYSALVSTQYTRRSLAKAACAKIALEQGIVEFIKHGDGLKEPIVVPFVGGEAMPPSAPPTVTSLQAFHAALPKPLPDHIETKSNGEINGVAWVNTLVQSAKGSRMTVMFHWYTDSKLGLHGCLLRLSRPDGPSQSYLVDAIFSKRADAKLAVCLLACSQGLGDYVRGVVAEIEARISTEMRRRCIEQILPTLGQALNKVKHGMRPDFQYDCDLSTFGCTLTINLPSNTESESPVVKQWKVPLAYKSKIDAKIAVACVAADDGLIDFIKYRGQPPPTSDDQASEMEIVKDIAETELEEGETTLESGRKQKNKKAKKDEKDITRQVRDSSTIKAGDVPLFETKEEARARGRFDMAPGMKVQQRNFSSKVRGRYGGFGHPGIRGGSSRSGDAPARRRQFGGPGGFPTPHRNFPQFYPHSHIPPYGSRAPAHYHPYHLVPPAGGLGFADSSYPLEYEHRGYYLGDPGPAHERYAHGLGGPGVSTETSFTRAPPPVPPAVMPDYHRYHDRDRSYDFIRDPEYGNGPNAQPPHSSAVPTSGSGVPSDMSQILPYDYDYPTAAVESHHFHESRRYPQALSAEYPYETDEFGRSLARGHTRGYEPGHFAPDYNRIPERSTGSHVLRPHAHEQAVLRRSGGAAWRDQDSMTSHPLSHSDPSHSKPTAAVLPSSHPSLSQQDGISRYDPYKHLLHAERLRPRKLSSRPRPTQVQSDGPELVENKVNNGTSGLGKDTNEITSEHHTPPGPESVEYKVNNGTSGLGKDTNEITSEHHAPPSSLSRPARLPTPTPGQTPFISPPDVSGCNGAIISPEESVIVPSKRARSSDESNETESNKRPRGKSRSMSQEKDQGNSGNVPAEALGPSPEKDVSASLALSVDEKGVSSLKQAQDLETAPPAPKPQERHHKGKSHLAALLEQCVKEGRPTPEFRHAEMFKGTDKPFKVWMIMGKERLELPTSFPTLSVGKERLAKSVLGRIKLQSKTGEEI